MNVTRPDIEAILERTAEALKRQPTDPEVYEPLGDVHTVIDYVLALEEQVVNHITGIQQTTRKSMEYLEKRLDTLEKTDIGILNKRVDALTKEKDTLQEKLRGLGSLGLT